MLYFFVVLYVAAIYIRPAEIVPAWTGTPILDWLAIGAAVAAVGSLALEPRKFWDWPQDKMLLLYYFALIVSNPLNGWLGGGFLGLSAFFPTVFCYFLIRLGVRTPAQVGRFTAVFVMLNVLLAANGLLQVFTGQGFGAVEAMETRDGARILGTGIFNDPNDLGMTLVMAVPFVLTTAFGSRSRFFARMSGLLALLLLVAACYYTNSRGTILGLGAVVAARMFRRFGITTATILASVALTALLTLGPSRMSMISAEEASAQGRIQAWSEGLQMFKSAPVSGVGFRRFSEYHELAAHNSFIHVLAELGFVGALAFVGMFYWLFVGLGRAPAGDPPRARTTRDLSDSTVGLLTCICFLSRQYVVVPFIPLALGAGLGSATEDRRGNDVVQLTRIAAITAALVLGFYVIVRVFARFGM
jgi:O-antigen ligase